MGKIVNINLKAANILFDTGSNSSVMSYEIYINIEFPKSSFDVTLLCSISGEIV